MAKERLDLAKSGDNPACLIAQRDSSTLVGRAHGLSGQSSPVRERTTGWLVNWKCYSISSSRDDYPFPNNICRTLSLLAQSETVLPLASLSLGLRPEPQNASLISRCAVSAAGWPLPPRPVFCTAR